MGKIANRQLLVFSERGQFSQAILQFHVERMLTTGHQSRDPNRNATNAGPIGTNFCVFQGDITPTHASDSNRGDNSR